MRCTSCGNDLGPPPTVCRPCGKRFVPRKKADVHAARTQPTPVHRSGAMDLHSMPTRPAPVIRRPEPGLHDMATRPAPVKRPVRRRTAPVPKEKDPRAFRRNVLLAGGVIAVVLGGGIFTWRMLNAPPADIRQEEVYVIRPASHEHRTFDRLGDFAYRLEVTALDGPLHAVMGGVSDPKEPQPVELERLLADGKKPGNVVRSGKTRTLEGVIRNAYPIWFIFNFDDGKSARARVRFVLQER